MHKSSIDIKILKNSLLILQNSLLIFKFQNQDNCNNTIVLRNMPKCTSHFEHV